MDLIRLKSILGYKINRDEDQLDYEAMKAKEEKIMEDYHY